MARDSGLALVSGMLVGVTAMFFLDPRSGRRRRAEAGHQVAKLAREVEQSLASQGRDLRNRAQGQVARTTRVFRSDLVEDHRLEARVRSTLGHLTSQARAITVEVREGHVRLLGMIPQADLGDVLTGLRRVPGVTRLESLLLPIPKSGDPVPHNAPSPQPHRPEVPAEPLSPPARAIVGAAGGLLAIWGLRHGGTSGAAGAALGGWMIARSLVDETEHPWIAAGGPPTFVQKTVEVEGPVQQVFAAWTNFSSFPRFMAHLREVRESESGISYWVADGPAGLPVSWSAEVVALQPFKRVAWRSVEGSMIRNAGEVQFEDVAEDRTRIHVRMAYQPPAGQIGSAVAACFGADPRRQLDEDLRRFKALLETDAAATAERVAR